MSRTPMAATFLVVVLAPGCGPKSGDLQAKHPWDPDLVEYFDDSVDFTMNPDSLSGQWMYSYRLELEGRVSLSDFIVAVKVQSVSVESDMEDRQLKVLSTVVEKNVKGVFPRSGIVLSIPDDQPGFDSFDEDDPRLTDKVFIAFLRLYETETGPVGIHWHLSPLSKGLMKAMDEVQKQGEEEQKKGKDEDAVYTLETE